MRHSIGIVLLLLLIAGNLNGQTKKEKKKLKEEAEAMEFAATRAIVESGVFDFRADWATSNQGIRVNLATNPNYMKLQREEADVYLPYFGVAHTANPAFSTEGAVVLQGPIREMRTEVNEKKQTITLRFKGDASKENLDFFLTVFRSGNALLNVNSNVRSGIRYDGEIREKAATEK